MPMRLIDTHCHLDAAEFDGDRATVRERARAAGVGCLVLPAVHLAGFEAVRQTAHAHHDAYALGVHPLYVQAKDVPGDVVASVAAALAQSCEDPHLVAVGEIGLDFFVPGAARQPPFGARPSRSKPRAWRGRAAARRPQAPGRLLERRGNSAPREMIIPASRRTECGL